MIQISTFTYSTSVYRIILGDETRPFCFIWRLSYHFVVGSPWNRQIVYHYSFVYLFPYPTLLKSLSYEMSPESVIDT